MKIIMSKIEYKSVVLSYRFYSIFIFFQISFNYANIYMCVCVFYDYLWNSYHEIYTMFL